MRGTKSESPIILKKTEPGTYSKLRTTSIFKMTILCNGQVGLWILVVPNRWSSEERERFLDSFFQLKNVGHATLVISLSQRRMEWSSSEVNQACKLPSNQFFRTSFSTDDGRLKSQIIAEFSNKVQFTDWCWQFLSKDDKNYSIGIH